MKWIYSTCGLSVSLVQSAPNEMWDIKFVYKLNARQIFPPCNHKIMLIGTHSNTQNYGK